jgi:hypothetical protein
MERKLETTQMVSTPKDVAPDTTGTGDRLKRATVWVDLKPERVQEDLAATEAGTISLSLQMSFGPSQTVTFGLSGSGLAITFNNVLDNALNQGIAGPVA